MRGYTSRFFLVADLNLHLLDWGDPANPAVFLFHPTSGHAHDWDKVAAALAPQYRVLALDARDHGDSDPSPSVYDPNIKADEVLDIAGQLGIDRFSVVGNSMGGRLATYLAFKHPNRVDRLVMEDVGPEVGANLRRQPEERFPKNVSEFNSLDEVIAHLRLSRPFAPDDWLRHVALHGTVPLASGKRLLKHRRHVPWVPSDTPAERWAQLPFITCPTLVIRGSESLVMDEDILNRTVAGLPNAKGATVPNADHLVHDDNIDGFLEILLPFFDMH